MIDFDDWSPGPVFVAGTAIMLAIVASVAAFTYNPAPAEANTPAFLKTQDGTTPPGSFEVTSRLHSSFGDAGESSTWINHGKYDAERPASWERFRIKDDGVEELERVGVTVNGTVYTRHHEPSDEEFETALQVEGDGLAVINNTTNTYVAVEARTDQLTRDDVLIDTIAVDALGQFKWERTGTTTYKGRPVVTYTAQDGWNTVSNAYNDGTASVLIKEANGTLYVDQQTGLIVYTDLTGTLVRAKSWAAAQMATPIEVEVTYELTITDATTVTRPDWASGINQTQSDDNATITSRADG